MIKQHVYVYIQIWKLCRQGWGFPGVSEVKNLPAIAGDTRDAGSIPGLGRSPGGGHGNPLQYSCLGNSMEEEPGELQSVVRK